MMQENETYAQDPEVKPLSLGRRFIKNGFHYLIVIPGLILILIFKVMPFLTGLRLPFVDYKLFRGLSGSSWVGLANFRELFSSINFYRIMTNTLSIKITYIFFMALAALVLSLALSGIKSGKIKSIFATVFAIPYFIPSVVISYYIILLLSPTSSPFFSFQALVLADNRLFRIPLIAGEVLKNLGVPVLVSLAAIQYSTGNYINSGMHVSSLFEIKLFAALKAVAAFALIQLTSLLTFDLEALLSLINPLVYDTADTIDTFVYRSGFVNMQLGLSGALWLTRFCIQALLTLGVWLIFRSFFKNALFNYEVENSGTGALEDPVSRSGVGGAVVSAILIIPTLLLIFMVFIRPFFLPSASGAAISGLLPGSTLATLVTYAFITFIAVAVNAFITLTLAYPMTSEDLPGRGIYKVFLLLVLNIGGNSISEYIFFKNLGAVNTVFPYLITGFFSIINIFVLKAIFNSKYGGLKERESRAGKSEAYLFFKLFIPKTLKTLLALSVLQFVTMWNSYYTSLLYTNTFGTGSPAYLLKQVLTIANGQNGAVMFNDPAVMRLAAVIALPPLALFLAFRKFLTGGVFVSRMRDL